MTVVTPPVAANNLLALVGATTPVGYATDGGYMLLDHANDVAYFLELSPTTGAAGLKRLTVGTNGTEVLQSTETTTFGAGPAHTFSGGTACIHPNGNIYANVDGGNSCPIAIITGSTLLSNAVVGASSASFSPSDNSPRFLLSFQMVPLRAGDVDYIISRGLTAGSHENEVGVFKVTNTTIYVAYATNTAEAMARICAGNNGTDVSVASFYVVGDEFSRGGGTTTPVTLYEYLVHDLTVGKRTIGTVAPHDIDAAWTHFSAVSNPGYDTADGNILCFFSTQDAAPNSKYLAKFNVATGAIIWKIAVITVATDLPNCSLNGTLGILNTPIGGNRTLDLVNLASGAVTTQNWNNGFSATFTQTWDYASGSLTGNMSYTQSTGTVPTYLGAYLAAHSNTIPTSRWGRLFTAQTYVTADPNPPPAGSAPQRAWTYTLDGHTFYVIDLDAEGTFVYDLISGHWSKFITTSTTPLWNMAGGAMWNGRVTAGDRASNKVWELDPNATLDNGTDKITRVVTGLMPMNSRNYFSVGAVRLDCSAGALSGSGDSQLDLRFSDDLENSWSPTFSLVLIAGDFNEDVSFRSLGSFASPGRVFEFSDTGGLVRINSAAVDPENDQGGQSG